MAFDLVMHPGYYVVRFHGVMSPDDLAGFARAAEPIERAHPEGLDRIADLTAVEVFNVQYAAVSDLAKERRVLRYPRLVKSAIVADRPVAVGFARMYQTILSNPDIDVRIFTRLDEALRWLAESDLPAGRAGEGGR